MASTTISTNNNDDVQEPTDFPVQTFASQTDFEQFLDQNHQALPGVYVKFAKKATGIPSITGSEAIEVALCFGWIDGKAGRTIDPRYWLVRYRPRLPKSLWSQKNVGTVGRLIDQGKMRPAGLAAVNAAKADGRWDRAYAGPATITVPDDFQTVLDENSNASEFFAGLNKTQRYAVLWRIATVSPKGRAKKMADLVQMLSRNEVPGTPGVSTKAKTKPSTKPARVAKVNMKKEMSPLKAGAAAAAAAANKPVSMNKNRTTITTKNPAIIGASTAKLQMTATQVVPKQPPRRTGLRPRP